MSEDLYKIILRTVITEKAINQIEKDNRLVFVVANAATKPDIKSAIEKLYSVKVHSINTRNALDGEKRAYIRLAKGSSASDVASKLGVL